MLAFEAAFESTAFASFEIAGVHAGLQDDIHVATGTHWSDWFAQMGWDHGWIITDLRAARVRVVCAS